MYCLKEVNLPLPKMNMNIIINFNIFIINNINIKNINIVIKMNKINIYCSKEANLPRHSLQSTGSAIAVEV